MTLCEQLNPLGSSAPGNYGASQDFCESNSPFKSFDSVHVTIFVTAHYFGYIIVVDDLYFSI